MKLTMVYSLAVVLSLGLYGCSGSDESESMTESSSSTDGSDHEHSDEDHDHDEASDEAMTDMEKMKAALADLSPEDAASAEKQHMCPVSDEMLGAMGAPIKIDVDGQEVWICCEGCRDPLLEDPAKYLAKLKN